MIIETIVFYLLAVVTVAAGVMVIASRNPVQSVLFLILAFFNSAGLFVLLGAEFLAMILIIIYVGAVAVLFLFVVMMLDINFSELRAGFLQYLPIGAIVGIILLAELILVFATGAVDIHVPDVVAVAMPAADEVSNTRGLGQYSLYPLCLFVPGRGIYSVGRHGWRHRADPSPARRSPAPEHRRSGGARPEGGGGSQRN